MERRSAAHATILFPGRFRTCSASCSQSVLINLRTIFAIEKLGTISEQNDRKMIKIRIEYQQLTGKVDLGTTWEQKPPNTG